jgi:hypothetical protein
MFLDTDKWVQDVEARIAVEHDPTVLRNLGVVRDHMIAERDGDLDKLMDTLSGSPVYLQWGAPQAVQPKGRDQVRAAYEEFVRTKRGSYLEYDIDRIVADASTVITDGVRKSVFPGHFLAAADGFPVRGYPVESPETLYLLVERQITTWPFDADGLLTGEEGYRVVVEVRSLTPDEIDEVAPIFASIG